MTGIWQEIIVGAIVLSAVAYLARQLWLMLVRKRTGGCASSCDQCTTGPAESRPLVSLEVPAQKTPRS